MELLKIDKGIPIITNTGGTKAAPHPYPFELMQVGDSFIKRGYTERSDYSGYNPNYAHVSNKACAYCRKVNKGLPKEKHVKFAIRKVAGGFRCWRVK